jgi:hypothetical protein
MKEETLMRRSVVALLGCALVLATFPVAAQVLTDDDVAVVKRRGADDGVSGGGDDRGGRGGDDRRGGRGGDDRGRGRGGRGGNGGNGGGGGGATQPRNRAGVLKFDQRSFEVVESAGVARIVVERSRGEQGAVSVQVTASAGTADSADFTPVTKVLTWAAGDGTNRVVEVPLANDADFEGNETVQLALSQPTGGATLDPVRGTSKLVILDDDGPKSCAVSASTLCLAEGRFAVQVAFRGRDGLVRAAKGQARSGESALFTFAADAELLVKVADLCAGEGAFRVTLAAAVDDPFLVTVTDTATGLVKQYSDLLADDAVTFGCAG